VLDFFVTFRKTGTHCGIGDCTMVAITRQIGSCNVSNESCKVNGQLFLEGGADPGQVEVLDVYAESAGVRTFSMGLITIRPN
jgi:hypothetical protein